MGHPTLALLSKGLKGSHCWCGNLRMYPQQVGSTLADPYLAYSAGLNALAGPLHGLANQEVLSWILDLQKKFKAEGKPVNHDTITEFAWETLKSGKVSMEPQSI